MNQTERLGLWGGAALLLLMGAFRTMAAETSDFSLVWQTASSLLHDGPAYPERALPTGLRVNLNPPTASVLLLPLTVVSVRAAFVVWSICGAAMLACSLWIVGRTVAVPSARWPWVVGALIVPFPCLLVWQNGQLTWALTLLVTLAWASRIQPMASSIWLGVAIAIKPTLAPMALVLGVQRALMSGLVALGITGLVALYTGLDVWRDWVAASSRIDWLPEPPNASLWGEAARIVGWRVNDVRLADLSAEMMLLVGLISLGCFMAAWRTSGHARWLWAVVWSVLVSPLGWIYMLPVALGPILALWRGTRRQKIVLAIWCVPLPMLWALTVRADWLVPIIGFAPTLTMFGSVYALTHE